MLFYTDKTGKILLHKEVYQIVPEFKKLKDKEMLYVILSTDYFAMFHQYPPRERKQKAKRWIFGNDQINIEADPKIRSAIEQYQRIQYDEKRHSLDVFLNKKTQLEIAYQNEENPERSDKYLTAIQNVQKVIDRYKDEIAASIHTAAILKGGKEKSLLEIMASNGSLYDMRAAAVEKNKNIHIENQLEYNENEILGG